MDLLSTLRELQALCDLKGLKFKGKTKDALRTLLNSAVEVVDDSLDIDDDIIDIENKKLKDLKLICERRGLSKIGSRVELVRRIQSSTEKRVFQYFNGGREEESKEKQEKLVQMMLPDGSTINLFDNEKEGDRLIILGSNRGLKTVAKSKILLTDGTFNSAPSTTSQSFYQFFVIHAEFMETGEIFPCLFCLMEHRTKENYEELYNKVKELIKERGWGFSIMSSDLNSKVTMYMDMELANRQAVASCLGNPLICVCNFHLTGVTNKTIVDMGLKRLVLKSPIFNYHCRMINSLATVPERFVTRAYDKLHKYLDDNLSDALQVLEYWGKHLVKGYIVLETQNHVLPKWKVSK